MTYLKEDEPFLVIIGPSGSGKSRIVNDLVRQGLLELTPSWTTRPLRPQESDDITHHFVSSAEFETLKNQGFFLESRALFGMDYQYGLPKITNNKTAAVSCVVLRANLLPLLRKYYTQPIVYQIEVDAQTARRHITNRQGDSTEIDQRLATYEQEIAEGRKDAQRVFQNNGSYNQLRQQVIEAIRKDFPI